MPFYVLPEPTSSPAGRERRLALVIGNSDYRFAKPLENPVNDALSVAEVLSRLGFEVIRALDIKMSEMGDVQEAFEAKLRTKPDIALLYYGGHGLQVKGINYFVPIDSQIEAPAHLSTRAIRFNDILDPMAEEVHANLIFLDACRENPFTRNLSRTLGEGARGSIRGGLARIEKVAGTFIAYATAPDEVAYDGKAEHSPFTSALLKHIETPGLSVSDMMIDVRNSVLEATKRRQEPWDQSSLRARFYFVPNKPEEPPPPGHKPGMPPQLSQASKEWEVIQNTTSLAVLARFKERHPESYWCDLADARAEELRSADELRRKAAEDKRAKKWTVSDATSALTSKLGALTSLLREADEKRHQSIKTKQPEKEGDTTPPIESPHDKYSGEAAKEREKVELAAWEAVKDTKDAEKLAIFLREWSNSPHKAEARRRKRRLEGGLLQKPPVRTLLTVLAGVVFVGIIVWSLIGPTEVLNVPTPTEGTLDKPSKPVPDWARPWCNHYIGETWDADSGKCVKE